MARKNERRKVADRRGSRGSGGTSSGGKRVSKPVAKPKAKAEPPTPSPAPKIKFRGKLLENEPLARHNTWRIGGPARYLAMPADTDDVVRALELAQDRGLPWVVLGLGSNVLIKDGGFPGVVIRMGKGLDRFEMKGATAIVGAGMPTPILARRTAEAGFVGVERFVGIPGTVGGGIFMNAGCHGAEFAEIVTEVTVMDPRGKVKQLSRKQISFKYRSSNIEGIVLEAKLGLGEESPAKLKELQGKLFRWRKAGTPFDQPCCGSTFRNPTGSTKTAGMVIDEAGLKGFTIGGAQVSTMHANYIINKGTATASDVLKVIEHIRKTVAKKAGITLELECKIIGV
ncbi:MAG: UDP-N-acetylenolpyruvoylglucosamine reductase [Gemmatimonadetes bacterium]|nr:MAG: UDP-N-acetylenolpyruvoylglucosamine reductase [Gemmatimonadota bacterium]